MTMVSSALMWGDVMWYGSHSRVEGATMVVSTATFSMWMAVCDYFDAAIVLSVDVVEPQVCQ